MNLKFKISLAAAIILAAVLAFFGWPVGKSEEAAPTATPPVQPAYSLFDFMVLKD